MQWSRLLLWGIVLSLSVACQATDFVGGGDPLPQGQGVIYQVERELWVADVTGEKGRRLSTDLSAGGCASYLVAPNGRSVAYRDRAGALWVAPLPGEPRQIAESVEDMTWFPNSKGVAYSSGSDLYLHFLNRNEKPQRFSLQGQRLRRPTWSPDTRTVAFYILNEGNRADLAVVPFPASSLKEMRILDSFTMEPGGCPPPIRWAPDSTRLVAGDGKRQFAYFLSGGSPIPLGAAEPPAAWTVDSRRIVYVDGKGRLALRELMSGEIRPLANGGASAYRWSPDGSKLAFIITDADSTKLMLFDQTTQRRHLLVDEQVVGAIVPQWSADSSTIYFGMRGGPGGMVGVGRVAAVGGPVTPVVVRASSFRLLERPGQ